MENAEEVLHHLEEFAKLKPKCIPRELEDYLCFVAKTGDPVYQWSAIKCLFREKLISVITDFYESCPSVDVPPCPNVDLFNYDTMKTFILDKLDTFIAAPFTVQRICELLTTPRKEYNRIDKYMRALEKNILVVSTTEPGHQRTPENGDGFVVNGIESDHAEINIEEMDDGPMWPRTKHDDDSYQSTSKEADDTMMESLYSNRTSTEDVVEPEVLDAQLEEEQASTSNISSSVITCCAEDEQKLPKSPPDETPSLPAVVQRRRNSIEPITEQLDEDLSALDEENTIFTESKSDVDDLKNSENNETQPEPPIVDEESHKPEEIVEAKVDDEETANISFEFDQTEESGAKDVTENVDESQVIADKQVEVDSRTSPSLATQTQEESKNVSLSKDTDDAMEVDESKDIATKSPQTWPLPDEEKNEAAPVLVEHGEEATELKKENLEVADESIESSVKEAN